MTYRPELTDGEAARLAERRQEREDLEADEPRHDYRVTWEIDVTADSPEGAAEEAWEAIRDPESTATVFQVRRRGPRRLGRSCVVDLMQGDVQIKTRIVG